MTVDPCYHVDAGLLLAFRTDHEEGREKLRAFRSSFASTELEMVTEGATLLLVRPGHPSCLAQSGLREDDAR